MSLTSRVLKSNPGVQVASVLSGSFSTPSSKGNAIGIFDLITESIITTNTASVTFSFLPGNYSHLEVWISGRTTRSVLGDAINIQLNETTANGCSGSSMYAQSNLASPYTGESNNSSIDSFIQGGRLAGASAASGTQGSVRFVIMNYSNTNLRKTYIAYGGTTNAGATDGLLIESWGLSNNLGVITSMKIYPATSTNFVNGSRISLYGVA